MDIRMEVWICPTVVEEDGETFVCGNYFASKNETANLSERLVGDRGLNGERFEEDRHRHRSTCPDCFEAGRGKVERIRIAVVVDLDQLSSATYDEAVSA